MTTPRITAFLFDLDGTLADTARLNVAAYAKALSEAGVAVAPGVLERNSPGRHWSQFIPPILAGVGSSIDPASIAERKKSIYAGLVQEVRLNVALLGLLDACRASVRTGLVTTASKANVDALIDTHDLRRRFDIVVTGDDVNRHKPHPEAYLIAAQRLGVSPADCLVFEDSDIGERSARDAGMHVQRIVFRVA